MSDEEKKIWKSFRDMTEMILEKTILWPEVKERQDFLIGKLEEYHHRLELPDATADTIMKQFILLHVMKDGKIDMDFAIAELVKLNGGEGIDGVVFMNAWGVIYRYCHRNGEGVTKGHRS